MEGHLCTHAQGTKSGNQCSFPRYRQLRYYFTGHTGKRGGAIGINTSLMAPIAGDEGKTGYITETIAADVSVIDPEIQNFDLYSVGYDNKKTVQPFVH